MTSLKLHADDVAMIVAYVDGDLEPEATAAFEDRLVTERHLEEALREFLLADELGRRLARGALPAAGKPRRTDKPR